MGSKNKRGLSAKLREEGKGRWGRRGLFEVGFKERGKYTRGRLIRGFPGTVWGRYLMLRSRESRLKALKTGGINRKLSVSGRKDELKRGICKGGVAVRWGLKACSPAWRNRAGGTQSIRGCGEE